MIQRNAMNLELDIVWANFQIFGFGVATGCLIKKEDTIRPFVDLWKMKEVTKPDRLQLTIITDIASGRKKARHQIPLTSEVGRNSAKPFQRYVDKLLIVCRSFAMGYIEDIMVYSQDPTEHRENIEKFLKFLRTGNYKRIERSIKSFGLQISHQKRLKKVENDQIYPEDETLRKFIGTIAFH